MRTFSNWIEERRHLHIPASDRVVPLVAAAGAAGMTRRQIGSAIDLEPRVLDALLDALVRSGLLSVTWHDGFLVYRASAAGTVSPLGLSQRQSGS